MTNDNPYPCPSPNILAEMLAVHAWSDHIDDHTRMLMEWGSETIRRFGLDKVSELSASDGPKPTAYQVANFCAQSAWRQDVPLDMRMLLETAADLLREQYRERLKYASRVEQVEAERDLLRRVHYGPQKGGAA